MSCREIATSQGSLRPWIPLCSSLQQQVSKTNCWRTPKNCYSVKVLFKNITLSSCLIGCPHEICVAGMEAGKRANRSHAAKVSGKSRYEWSDPTTGTTNEAMPNEWKRSFIDPKGCPGEMVEWSCQEILDLLNVNMFMLFLFLAWVLHWC